MVLPNKVKIGATIYSIRSNDDLEKGTAGTSYDVRSELVYRKSGVSSQQQVSTVLHEVLHAIMYTYGIRQAMRFNEESEETLVVTMENAIMALIKDNPKLVKAIQDVR